MSSRNSSEKNMFLVEYLIIVALIGLVALSAWTSTRPPAPSTTKTKSKWNLSRGDIFYLKDGSGEQQAIVINNNESVTCYRTSHALSTGFFSTERLEKGIIRVIRYEDPNWKFAAAQYLGIEPTASPAPSANK